MLCNTIILFYLFQFKCCGAYGSENSSHSWALYKQETFWVIDKYSSKFKILVEDFKRGYDSYFP